jgi:hypothetical protein
MFKHVLSMLPADGWECLVASYRIDVPPGTPVTIRTAPVIAWAINPLGAILPIMPYVMRVKTAGPCGFRKAGDAKVHVPADSQITYDDEQQWLSALQFQADQEREKEQGKPP